MKVDGQIKENLTVNGMIPKPEDLCKTCEHIKEYHSKQCLGCQMQKKKEVCTKFIKKEGK